MTEPTTHTLERPGATLTYDVRAADAGDGVPLLLFGSPMDATGFASLASHFPDRLVVTYDPRGTTERSPRDDTSSEISPDEHAADLEALVEALGGGPVDAFASSGGAVNALAWAARAPQQARRLVAHEPPLATVLPDNAALQGLVDQIVAAYQARGHGAGMAAFIATVMHEGEVPDGFVLPDVDPAMFGIPTDDDGSRDDPLLHQNMRRCTAYDLDEGALRDLADRIVMARGEASGDTWAARGATGVAERIGARLEMVPGDHGGFFDGEGPMGGDPAAFAVRLRELLG